MGQSRKIIAIALLSTAIAAVSAYSVDSAATELPQSIGRVWRLTDPAIGAQSPRFSPDGSQIVCFAGPQGAADIYLVSIADQTATRLTEDAADDRDPTFNPLDGRIVWSSNRAGSYDLYTMAPDGSDVVQLTELEGDELEPAVSPLSYIISTAGYDECSEEGASGVIVDTYGKVVFTRRFEGRQEIWFQSTNRNHLGPVSPESLSCHSPSWSGNGLNLAWVCDSEEGSTVFHGEAQWDRSLMDALNALASELSIPTWEFTGCEYQREMNWEEVVADPCLSALPRRFGHYEGVAASEPASRLGTPGYSANQTLLIAHHHQPVSEIAMRSRVEGSEWVSVPFEGPPSRQVVWSPTGQMIAFEAEENGQTAIYLAEADFYLQDVVDLVDYPELYGEGFSPLLHANRFVARPGTEREFFRLYDQIGYRRRGVFVTADAALQAYHDEFARLLRTAERDAASKLLELTEGLFQGYAGRLEEPSGELVRYYAEYFGVPMVLLKMAAAMGLTGEEYFVIEAGALVGEWDAQQIWNRAQVGAFDPSEATYLTAEELARLQQLLAQANRPVEDQLGDALAAAMEEIPEPLREGIRQRVTLILAHEGLGTIQIPGQAELYYVDYTQFIPRGHYTGSDLMGYFWAMMWFGQVPLPMDSALFELVELIDQDSALRERYDSIDRLVGAFMGRPVDVTVAHVRQVRSAHPELLGPFQAAPVMALLAELRGPIPFRGLQVAAAQLEDPTHVGEYPLQFTFFPRRYGLDVEFFSKLTHPEVFGKPYPTALELFAGLGIERAAEYALAWAQGETYLEAYREALRAQAEFGTGLPDTYFSTDLYHSLLALLRTLAIPFDLPPDSPLAFARSSAWPDRLLLSALAGFTQLKHDAVLYSFQEYGVEAGGDMLAVVLTEQAVLPPPRGFVDPLPVFFANLAQLAGRVYGDLASSEPPEISGYLWSRTYRQSIEEILSAQRFAARLSELAAKEVAGEALTEEDHLWLSLVGAMLEQMFLSQEYMDEGTFGNDEGRIQTGIALAADVYTNIERQEVIQLAIGRIMDLFVVVPNTVGQRMVQGGIYSFYEFTQPMSERLTDMAWNERIEADDLPPLPPWSRSFIEAVFEEPAEQPADESGEDLEEQVDEQPEEQPEGQPGEQPAEQPADQSGE
ncbi:MAG: DUF3160 domain-containing protein [Bradymonadales bacterium]|nr:DUF3160 domain-containing protein [Bradymonadales bacterium]